MNETENLIIPTSEIAFAVKKDGSVICDDNPKSYLDLWRGLTKHAEAIDAEKMTAFALACALCSENLRFVVAKRLETMASELKKRTESGE